MHQMYVECVTVHAMKLSPISSDRSPFLISFHHCHSHKTTTAQLHSMNDSMHLSVDYTKNTLLFTVRVYISYTHRLWHNMLIVQMTIYCSLTKLTATTNLGISLQRVSHPLLEICAYILDIPTNEIKSDHYWQQNSKIKQILIGCILRIAKTRHESMLDHYNKKPQNPPGWALFKNPLFLNRDMY